MSNSYAIAAVTATLSDMIVKGIGEFTDLPDQMRPNLSGEIVTTLTLDKAHDDNKDIDRINLFLYQIAYNAAWRNMDLPVQVKSGETGRPPLALNLYYLITAYGAGGNLYHSQVLLGRAMQILHDNPLLKRDEIKQVLGVSELQNQIECVRITPVPMSLDDISKLWMSLQTQYRTSAAYQVEVVLIDSKSRVKTPLPVLGLRHADQDKGIISQPDLTPPFPELTELVIVKEVDNVWVELSKKHYADLGDTLSLKGHHLSDGNVKVHFINPRLKDPVSVIPDSVTATELRVAIPDAPDKWVAGIYRVEAVIKQAGKQDKTTNELPIALAPRIEAIFPIIVDRSGGNTAISLNCSPRVLPEQRVSLLLGDLEIPANPHPAEASQLKFDLKPANKGEYLARMRIDGVDTSLVKDFQSEHLEFDSDRKVKIIK